MVDFSPVPTDVEIDKFTEDFVKFIGKYPAYPTATKKRKRDVEWDRWYCDKRDILRSYERRARAVWGMLEGRRKLNLKANHIRRCPRCGHPTLVGDLGMCRRRWVCRPCHDHLSHLHSHHSDGFLWGMVKDVEDIVRGRERARNLWTKFPEYDASTRLAIARADERRGETTFHVRWAAVELHLDYTFDLPRRQTALHELDRQVMRSILSRQVPEDRGSARALVKMNRRRRRDERDRAMDLKDFVHTDHIYEDVNVKGTPWIDVSASLRFLVDAGYIFAWRRYGWWGEDVSRDYYRLTGCALLCREDWIN